MLFCAVQDAPASEKIAFSPIDENWIARIGADDVSALEQLYRTTGRAVYTYALSLVKNPTDAQDLVQDTYLKIQASAHLYRPMGKPMAWIFTITRNLAYTRLSSNRNHVSTEDCDLENDPQYAYVHHPDDRLVLQSALRILTQEEREVIFLHCIAGMKHREIAADLDQSISTVLSRYHRALKKLKNYLKKEGGF